MAALKGHTEIVKALIAAKADVNVRAYSGGKRLTPLSVAKKKGHSQIIKLLKEYGTKE